MFKNRRNLIILISAVLLILAALFYFGVIKLPKPNVPLLQYSNPFFGISLKYPEGWAVDTNGGAFAGIPLRFAGNTGYFGINASASADDKASIDEVLSAEEGRISYGTTPTIESGTIDGREFRIVIPSKDQPSESKNQALALIRYPEKIKIGDFFFRYLIIYSDSAHIKDIISSLKFLTPVTSSSSAK